MSLPLAYFAQMLKILDLTEATQAEVLGNLAFWIQLRLTNTILENLSEKEREEFGEKLKNAAYKPSEFIAFLQELATDKNIQPFIQKAVGETLNELEDGFIKNATDKQKQEMFVWLEENI